LKLVRIAKAPATTSASMLPMPKSEDGSPDAVKLSEWIGTPVGNGLRIRKHPVPEIVVSPHDSTVPDPFQSGKFSPFAVSV
jgi:hypothetical protein